MASHSSSESAPGLFKMSAWTVSVPTSCRRADHRSRSRPSSGRRSSSAIKSVKARTGSACPRVLRSWALNVAARATICSAAMVGSSDMPRSRASSMRRLKSLVVPVRRATEKRLGARPGKTMPHLQEDAERQGSARQAFTGDEHHGRGAQDGHPPHERCTGRRRGSPQEPHQCHHGDREGDRGGEHDDDHDAGQRPDVNATGCRCRCAHPRKILPWDGAGTRSPALTEQRASLDIGYR